MYFCTVRFETRIPSLSSSPRIRSAPHRGFPLRHDDLLPKQRVLGHEPLARQHDISEQPDDEANEVVHPLLVSRSQSER